MSRKTFAVLSRCVRVTLCSAASGQEEPIDLLARTNAGGGLIVHVGVTDGRMEAEAADRGAYLVHGLALDDGIRARARTAIAVQGVYGLAGVATWHDRNRLSCASNLASIVVSDLDAIGDAAPGQKELMRIVAPEGALILKADGEEELNGRLTSPPAKNR